MTALAIGSSASIAVGDGGAVVIATNGGIATVSVTPVVGAIETFTVGPEPARRTFGPYSEGASLVLSNVSVGQMDYEGPGAGGAGLTAAEAAAVRGLVAKQDLRVLLHGDSQTRNNYQALAAPSVATYDSGTGVLSLTITSHGLQNGERVSVNHRSAPEFNGYSAVVSNRTANTFDVTISAGIATSPTAANMLVGRVYQQNVTGCWGYLKILCGGGLTLARNAGVVGDTITSIAQRVLTDVNPVAHDVMIVQAGHNSVSTLTADQMFGQFLDIVANYSGPRIVVVNMTPCTAAAWGGSAASNLAKTLAYNALLSTFPALYPTREIRVVDAYTLGAGGDGYAAAGATTDGTHWGGALSLAIARAVRVALQSMFGDIPDFDLQRVAQQSYDASTNPTARNKFSNGILQTVTGGSANSTPAIAGALGTVAAGMSVQRIGSITDHETGCFASPWGVGNCQLIRGTPLADNDTLRIDTASQHARFAPGQTIEAIMKVGLSGASGILKSSTLQVVSTTDGVTVTVLAINNSGTVLISDQEDRDGWVMRSEPVTLPAGTSLTSLTARFVNTFGAAGAGQASARVAQVELRRVA